MRKAERAAVAWAIDELMSGDGFDRGMEILCGLIGRPVADPLFVPATVAELTPKVPAHQQYVVTGPPDECAVHGRAFMLACPPSPLLSITEASGEVWTPPEEDWRHHWICMACCLLFGAAPIRAVAETG